MRRPGSHRGFLRFVLLVAATIAVSAAAGTAAATVVADGPASSGASRAGVVSALGHHVGHLPVVESAMVARSAKAVPLASLVALAVGLGLGLRPRRPARILAVEPGPTRRLIHADSAPLRGPPHPSHP